MVETKTDTLFKEEVTERNALKLTFLLVALFLLTPVMTFLASKHTGNVFFSAAIAITGSGVIGVLIFRLRKKIIFKIESSPDGELQATITGDNIHIAIKPASRIDFFFADQFSKYGSNRVVSGNALTSAALYAVFYNDQEQPVFLLTEQVMTVIVHIPKPGFREVDEHIYEIIESIPAFYGPVQKVREFCG